MKPSSSSRLWIYSAIPKSFLIYLVNSSTHYPFHPQGTSDLILVIMNWFKLSKILDKRNFKNILLKYGFHSKYIVWDSSIVTCNDNLFLLLLNSIPLYEYKTICLSIHWLMDICCFPQFEATNKYLRLQITYVSLMGHMISFLSGKYLWEEWSVYF